MNDIQIIASIVSVFILIGIFLPFVQDEFAQPKNLNASNGVQSVASNVASQSNNSTVTIWQVFISIGKMFFWTFGTLPLWLDSVFLMVRIILIVTIARNIWIGGGA